jgi:hypothetical protein
MVTSAAHDARRCHVAAVMIGAKGRRGHLVMQASYSIHALFSLDAGGGIKNDQIS